ncbi:hypothetical protein AGMMS49921_13610 [Endomicrobiia bacterium]|nr:hypothetical protein AGMMS49921_13610 [Endomicrobiia bacterium]
MHMVWKDRVEYLQIISVDIMKKQKLQTKKKNYNNEIKQCLSIFIAFSFVLSTCDKKNAGIVN